MNRSKELQEALGASYDTLKQVDIALTALKKASRWGWIDLWKGKRLSSYLKRRKIRQANRAIEAMERSVTRLQSELADVALVIPGAVSDRFRDHFWDIWVDNTFIDLSVQSKIKRGQQELKVFRKEILALIEQLKDELKKR